METILTTFTFKILTELLRLFINFFLQKLHILRKTYFTEKRIVKHNICVDTARNESYITIFRTAENCQIVIQAKISHTQFFPQKPSLACWSSVGSCLIVYSTSKECF